MPFGNFRRSPRFPTVKSSLLIPVLTLIDYLRKQFSAQGYTVQAIDGERTIPVTKDDSTGGASPVELNTRVVIPSSEFPLPMEFAVDFQSLAERVTLEGGEALEMRVARDGDAISGIPYDADVIDEAPLVGEASSAVTSPVLKVHRPRRSDDRVKFRFSVQDQDTAFTPRPKELWIAVTPDGSSEPYVYYDPVFEANTPVPVVAFTCIELARRNGLCSGQVLVRLRINSLIDDHTSN